MTHRMKLVDFAYEAIKNKEKDIELRLYDEKRQLIKPDDIIEFQNIDTLDILKVEVISLHICDTFKELFDSFEHKRFGLKDTDDESIMNNFYSQEEQEKYKALGIEVRIM